MCRTDPQQHHKHSPLHIAHRYTCTPMQPSSAEVRTRAAQWTCKFDHRQRCVIVRASAEGVDIDVEETTVRITSCMPLMQHAAQMERMEKSLEAVRRSFTTVRTGRANPSMLDRIEVQVECMHASNTLVNAQVDYYGTPTPLKTIAGVSVPESTQLVVQPYDVSAMQAIEKAIMTSDLGLTPSNDGKAIRINIPPLTAVRYT